MSPERRLCHSLRPVVVTAKSGFLASTVSADTGCGTGDSPWLTAGRTDAARLRDGRLTVAHRGAEPTRPGCGTGDSPWLVTLRPGQRINFTLYDFTTAQPPDDPAPAGRAVPAANSTSAGSSNGGGGGSSGADSRLCRVYATVRETNGARAVTVCGGQVRQRPAYVTLGHVAEVRLSTASASLGDVTVTSHLTFLLKYEGLHQS